MAFVKRTWIARDVQYPGRLILTPTGNTNEYDSTRSEGTINAEGDIVSKENLDDLENRIESGFEDAAAATAPDSLKLNGINALAIIDASGNAQNALKLGGNDAALYPMFSTGVWTPTLYGSTTSGTISGANMTGSYYKFGKLVYVAAGIGGTPSGAAGLARIGGLPFPIDTTVVGSNVGKTKRSALVDAAGVFSSTELNFWLGANEVNMTSLNGQSLNIGFSIWYVSTI